MGYYELAQEARLKVRKADGEERAMWKNRLQDLGIRVGNTLVEMGDLEGAARHLKTLRIPIAEEEEEGTTSTRLALLYLRIGNVAAARQYVDHGVGDKEKPATNNFLVPLLSMAEGRYDNAVSDWRGLRENSSEQGSAMITQNLAVCLLYTGQIDEVSVFPKYQSPFILFT